MTEIQLQPSRKPHSVTIEHPGDERPTARAQRPLPSFIRSVAIPAVLTGLAVATFVVDTITPYEIAAATFYVVVVLVAARMWPRRIVIGVSLSCVVLTVLSYFLTRHGHFGVGLVNTAISLIAIGATTYLAIRMEAAHEQAARAQANLARVARITTLGELAASIAHEVKQPLAAITTNANACARWMAADPPNLQRMNISIACIVQDANRASETLSRVRALTRGGEPQRTWVDVNRLIRETLALLEGPMRDQQIELRTDLSDKLPMVHVDAVQFQQVLINLAVNALEAIGEAGGAERTIQISAQKARGCDVQITVEDTGVGLDAARADMIFDAFYTTKPQGIGIGLSICRSIIEAHGGQLMATPRTGGGALFRFTLPGEQEQNS